MHQSFTILTTWMNSTEVTFCCTDFHFLGTDCFCTVTRRLLPKYILCSFHIAIYCITWIWNHFLILFAIRTTSRTGIQRLWWYDLNMWIMYPYVHERDVFKKKKKGGGIDVWYDTLFIGTCIIVLCFRFQCVLSRSSENWSLLRKRKVWPLFSKLEGRKCSNRGKITRNPKILSAQFENATCFTTFHSLYWKHKHPFPSTVK